MGVTGELPLGSVVFGKGESTIAVLAELTAIVHRWLWVVPCLAISSKQEPLEPLLMLVSELRDRLAVVKHEARTPNDDVARVLTAVRIRPLPTAQKLAQWAAQRLRNEEIEPPLRNQFREALEGVPASADVSVSTYSRLFARHGKYTARDWRAIARLCAHAVALGGLASSSVPMLPVRTASHYTKTYLAISYDVMVERLGWEWVLEAALRTGGYL